MMNQRIKKTKTISSLMLIALFTLAFTSCQKQNLSPENLNTSALASGSDKELNPNSHCLVTHTDNDLFGYSLDIYYNADGDPDSMSFGGFPATMKYDAKGRLRTANYGSDGVHFDFLYNGRSLLPSVLKYYYPGITYPVNNGLIAIDSFSYNAKGEMTKLSLNNLLFPAYNGVENYEYDVQGNVTKVSITAQNGGTVFFPGYVENEAFSYDNKRNFMTGSKWIKYILYNSGVFPADYFRMFSRNNALDWTWGYDGGYNPISADYEYNEEGFATKANNHLFDIDGVTEIIAFTDNSFSTCDGSGQKSQASPSKRIQLLPGNLLKLPGTLPLTIK